MIQDYYTKVKSSDDFVILAHLLLQNERVTDAQIFKRFNSKNSKGNYTNLSVEGLDLDLVYTKKQIKNLCVRNHFKFRHSSDANIVLTSEVISKIKLLEKKYSQDFQSFYVLMNHESDQEYAMLFCELPTGCFFKIDERAIQVKKIKSIVLYSSISLLFSMLFPIALVLFARAFLSWKIQLLSIAIYLTVCIGLVFPF